MPSALRQKRVADRLLQEISGLLLGMNDPRLSLVTVTVVNIDRELEHANVFVSTVGDEARRKEVMQVLNGAKGYIRREVSQRVQLRRSPELLFHWDPSPEKAEQISQLLDELKSDGPAAPSAPAAPAPEPEDRGDDQS
jgi:ribosome-binding factor A